MPSTYPIPRQSLHDELLGRIRSLIIDGELQPGAKVPERELCTRFKVSRTPLRETLKVLAAEGLVRLPPNRGAVISEIRLDELEECFVVLAELEALAAERCCVTMTSAALSTLREIHERMRAAHAAHDMQTYRQLNKQWHDAVVAGARNRVLSGERLKLAGRVQRTHLVATITRQRWDIAMQEHDRLMDSLEARAAPQAAAMMRAHLLHACDYYRGVLAPARARRA